MDSRAAIYILCHHDTLWQPEVLVKLKVGPNYL